MSGIDDLCRLPIVLAPMAGGPSTPELTAAVSEAGGLGVLAGGYLSPEELGRRIAAVERLTDRPFGANLFSPPARAETSPEQAAELRRYRELLVELGYPPELLPETPVFDDDGYRAKLEVVADSRAAVVSTAFGYPDEAATRLLRSRGKAIALKATTPEEIEYFDKADCDAIVVQGREAGGHRATVLSPPEAGSSFTLSELLDHAHGATSKPVVAAGGIATASDVEGALRRGAAAAQAGTAFLLAEEAGTKETHRRALQELRGRSTTLTRAFSGRLARGIGNAFIERVGERAPGLYPELHHLTSGLRAEANGAGDAEALNLWAGVGFPSAEAAPAARIVEALAAGAAAQTK